MSDSEQLAMWWVDLDFIVRLKSLDSSLSIIRLKLKQTMILLFLLFLFLLFVFLFRFLSPLITTKEQEVL